MPVALRVPLRSQRGIATRLWKPAIVLLAFALSAPQATLAQGVVIYRCTDANGALTIQNDVPCPKGSKQVRRVMTGTPAVSSAPPIAPAPSTPARAPVAPPVAARPARPAPAEPPAETEPVIADSDRLPPPWLFECRTYKDDTYLSENGAPAPRCVTLNPTGLSGYIESTNVSACEMKTDQCQRVPDGALCDGWRQRLREAQSALKFGVTDDRERDQAEVQRLERIVRESTCGKQ